MTRVLFAFTAALALSCTACAKESASAKKPSPAEAAGGARPLEAKPAPPACTREGLPQRGLKTAAVVVEAASGEHRFDVELCETERQRNVGMMCRDFVAADKGMLFIFDRVAPRSFWMRNTLIPLDMLFLDDEGRVVGIVEEAEPLTLTSRNPGAPAQYVLEVRGGTAKRLGLKTGDWVRFEGIEGHPAARPSTK